MDKKLDSPAKKQESRINTSRRNFIKTIAIGAVAVSAGAAISSQSNKAKALILAPGADAIDPSKGDAVMASKKYIEMSASEKKTLVGFLEDNYKKKETGLV